MKALRRDFAAAAGAALIVGTGAVATARAEIVRSAAGADAAAIQQALTDFRADLGALNANAPGSLGSGRREINWDAAPDTVSAPSNLPADFFNAAAAPRARGVVFATPGSGVAVSADDSNPANAAKDFANIRGSYAAEFEAFSPQRLFAPLGSNVTDVQFFIPGSATPALTRGFGSVFSDVDLAGSTRIEYYGPSDQLLTAVDAPALLGSQTFSFLGVSFEQAIVSRVRIITGTHALDAERDDAPGEGVDLAVMDDFVYGEPVEVPEPASFGLLAVGLAGLMVRRR